MVDFSLEPWAIGGSFSRRRGSSSAEQRKSPGAGDQLDQGSDQPHPVEVDAADDVEEFLAALVTLTNSYEHPRAVETQERQHTKSDKCVQVTGRQQHKR